MNHTLLAQLREIEPDIARSYERVCRNIESSLLSGCEQREQLDDLDTLVDQLLGELRKSEDRRRSLEAERSEFIGGCE